MVERGTLVALALATSILGGCPLPEDDAGEDEVGDAGESGESTGASEGDSGVTPNDDDLRAPDDANPEGESDTTSSDDATSSDDDEEGDDDEDDEDEGDDDDEGDDTGGSECWDLTSADGVLPIVVVDDTSSLADDRLGSCGQFGSPDFTFGFEAPFAGAFVFDTAGSSFDTVLYVEAGECGGEELACNDDFVGLASRLVLELDAGEQVSVVVDGLDGAAAGPFVLTIDEYEAVVCEAEPIPPALPQVLLGNTQAGVDATAGGCGGAGSPDDMYRFVAPGPGLYRFHTFGSAFDTVLYAWSDCEGPELACSDDANLELQSEIVVELAGGEHAFVIVDGLAGAAGPYQLNIEKL